MGRWRVGVALCGLLAACASRSLDAGGGVSCGATSCSSGSETCCLPTNESGFMCVAVEAGDCGGAFHCDGCVVSYRCDGPEDCAVGMSCLATGFGAGPAPDAPSVSRCRPTPSTNIGVGGVLVCHSDADCIDPPCTLISTGGPTIGVCRSSATD